MVKILQFLNGKPPKAVSYSGYQSSVTYRAAEGGLKNVGVVMIFTTFNDGSSGAVLVAADREVTHEEILDAHERYILRKRSRETSRVPIVVDGHESTPAD